MRRHRRFERLAPRIDSGVFHDIVAVENLVAARLEPGISTQMMAQAVLDLVFARDGRLALVPFVMIDGSMLYLHRASPFVWPEWLPPLRAQTAAEIESRLEPWLRSLTIARFADRETRKLFGSGADVHALVESARAMGLLGAAPTETVMRSFAPYVYALRFARGKHVRIADSDGANGAALLARASASVVADLGDKARCAVARQWFDAEIFGCDMNGDADVVIGRGGAAAPVSIRLDGTLCEGERYVEVATPILPYSLVSFDLADAPPVRRFAVRAQEVAPRSSGIAPVAVVGGSAGRIGIVLREDFLSADDADADAARALAARLEAQGFAPSLVQAHRVHSEAFDLLHLFGTAGAPALCAALERAGVRIPLVVTPYADDTRDEAEWGAAVHANALANADDEMLRRHYAAAIRDRKLVANGPERGRSALATSQPLRALLAKAAAAVLSGPAEEERLRTRGGFAGAVCHVPVLLGPEIAAADVGNLVGAEPFALLHAPVEPRCNQYPLVRAAAALGIPVVLIGTVQDIAYYAEVMAALGPGGMWLPSEGLTPGEISGLYARARVYVDVSWSSRGLYRLARAAATGAAIVAPSSGFVRSVWPGLAQIVDPGSPESIAEGLRAAWEQGPDERQTPGGRLGAAVDPFTALVSTLGAYRAAAGGT